MAANEVGQALAGIKARHGWTWAQTAQHLGMTPTYARKLASGTGKFGSANAGRSFAPSIAKFARTGQTQRPVQRAQKVRQRGGGSAPAPVRVKPRKATPSRFGVNRQAFAGGGTQVVVTMPRKGPNRVAGERAINDAIRDAARDGRHVSFTLTLYDGSPRTVGGVYGYQAGKVKHAVNVLHDGKVLEWLAGELEFSTAYGGKPFEAKDVAQVTVYIHGLAAAA